MKKLWMFILALCLFNAVFAQEKSKGKTNQSTEAKMEVPPAEELGDTKIAEVNVPPTPPKIDFDTSAAPKDALTDSIRKLLLITGARKNDIQMAEKSLRQSMVPMMENPETKEQGEKFINRFLYEMKDGDASRWLENMYIRSYRSVFTIEEVHDLINFYQTPAGRKTLEKTVLLLETVMTEARKIGAYLGSQTMEAVMAEEKNK